VFLVPIGADNCRRVPMTAVFHGLHGSYWQLSVVGGKGRGSYRQLARARSSAEKFFAARIGSERLGMAGIGLGG